MNWYYIDGPNRVGPLNETEWAELARAGKIRPETLVWHEGMEKWTPYREVQVREGEGDALADHPAFPEREVAENPDAFAVRVDNLDYPVNIGHCISRAWETFTANFGMLVGAAFFIHALKILGESLPLVGIVMSLALNGVLFGGMYFVFLRIMRGERAPISDLFVGFTAEFFKPLALTTLVASMVMFLCFLPAGIVTHILGMIPANLESLMRSDPVQAVNLLQETFLADPVKTQVWLLVVLTCSMPAVYFSFCWMYAVPLIIDKRMEFWPAMKLSKRKILQHPWRVAILSVVAGVFGYCGFLLLVFGIVLTLPLFFLIMLFLYEDMFNQPPRPSPKPETE